MHLKENPAKEGMCRGARRFPETHGHTWHTSQTRTRATRSHEARGRDKGETAAAGAGVGRAPESGTHACQRACSPAGDHHSCLAAIRSKIASMYVRIPARRHGVGVIWGGGRLCKWRGPLGCKYQCVRCFAPEAVQEGGTTAPTHQHRTTKLAALENKRVGGGRVGPLPKAEMSCLEKHTISDH